MKRMRAVESDSVKSARKAKDKLHKACERASETRERPLHRLEQRESLKPLSKLCRGKSEIECTKQAWESLKPLNKLCRGKSKIECTKQA